MLSYSLGKRCKLCKRPLYNQIKVLTCQQCRHKQHLARKAKARVMTNEEIDDATDRWHQNPEGKELHEYLGMTEEEYADWVKNPTRD